MKFWIVWPQNTLLSRFLAKDGPSGDQKWPLLGWNGCTQKYIFLKNTLFKLPKSAPWWGFRVDFDVGIVWSYEFIKKISRQKKRIFSQRERLQKEQNSDGGDFGSHSEAVAVIWASSASFWANLWSWTQNFADHPQQIFIFLKSRIFVQTNYSFFLKSRIFIQKIFIFIKWNKYLHNTNQGVFFNVHFLHITSET